MTDLFGNTITEKDFEPLPKTMIQKTLGKWHYRKAETKERRCATCANCFLKAGHAKRYYKCRYVGCTASPASDIRAGHVCDAWAKSEEAQG